MFWSRIRIRNHREVVLVAFIITLACVAISGGATWIVTLDEPPKFRATALALAIGCPTVLAMVSAIVLGEAIRKITLLKDDLAYIAWHDDMTGLFNRRAFVAMSERMISLGNRRSAAVSILLVDADRLKAVNDTYGHEAGDAILVAIAGALTKSTRRSDVAARFGGDEFAVLLFDAHADAAAEVAERIRATIEVAGAHVGVTASIGIARIDLTEGLDVALRCADIALYAAKELGRNRVESYMERAVAA